MEGRAATELTAPRGGRRRTGAGAAVAAVAARPRLWPAALRQARALVPARWWRRPPFLPVPDRDWLRFRMTTAYGASDGPIDVDDLLVWLAWTGTARPAPGGAPRPQARNR